MGGPVPFPPYLAWGCALPVGWVCASGAFQRRGVGLGGGGGLCAVPPDCAAGGASGTGGRLASVRPSAFPAKATKRVSLASLWPWRAWPPYRSGSYSLAVPGQGPCHVLACWRRFACPSRFLREGAAGAWGRALLWPPSRAPRSCRGEGGSSPLPRGGWGLAPPWLAGRVGGLGGQRGGSRPGSPPLSLGGAACSSLPSRPFVAGAFPPGVHVRSGSWGSPGRRLRPAAGGPAWRRGGAAAREPPPRRLEQTQSIPLPSLGRQHCRRLWQCSGHGGRGPNTALLRRGVPAPRVARVSFWRGFARRSQPPRELAVRGRGGPRRADPAACSPGCHGRLRGRGDVPSAPRGAEGQRPRGPQAGGERGGKGEGRPRRCSPPPCPVGWPVAPVPVTLRLRRTSLGYTRAVGVAGRSWAPGAARSAAGGSVWRGVWYGMVVLGLVRPRCSEAETPSSVLSFRL